MTRRKGRAPFHVKVELKQIAHAKILMSSILIGKRAHQIVEHAYHQASNFLSQKQRRSRRPPNPPIGGAQANFGGLS